MALFSLSLKALGLHMQICLLNSFSVTLKKEITLGDLLLYETSCYFVSIFHGYRCLILIIEFSILKNSERIGPRNLNPKLGCFGCYIIISALFF